jgi:hypothetical protein
LNVVAGQGSSRSHVMEAPTIVIPNGGTGSLFSGSIRPFVTGVTPIVGMGPMVPMPAPVMTSPLAERLERMRWSEDQLAAQAAELAARREAERVAAAGAALPRNQEDDGPLVLRSGRLSESEAPRSAGSVSSGSTANHGDLSLREIRQQQAEREAAREYEAMVLLEQGRGKEAEGKAGVAKIYYQQALAKADGHVEAADWKPRFAR